MLMIAVGCVLGLYLAVCLGAYLYQHKLLYFPQPRSLGPTESVMRLKVPGADLVVTALERPGTQALIYFGGNGDDVSLQLAPLSHAYPGRSLYLLHYRGYGGSTGRAAEADLHGDALALYDHVAKQHPQIAVIGRSLGTGVAIRVAAQRPVGWLVLVTPYNSITEIAGHQFPWLPVRWMLRDHYESWRHAPQVKAPSLLIAAAQDEVIPLPSTQRLFDGFAPGRARLEVLPGATHNSILELPRYWALLAGQDRPPLGPTPPESIPPASKPNARTPATAGLPE